MENTPSCKHFRSLADQYIEGELTAAQMRELEAHLAECEECRREFDELKALKDAIRSAREEMPEGLHERIMSAVKSEPKKKPARKRVFYRDAAISAACFMLCISFVVILSMLPFGKSGSGNDIPDDPLYASTEAVMTEISEEKIEVADSLAPLDTVSEPEIPSTENAAESPEVTRLEETMTVAEGAPVSSTATPSESPAPEVTASAETYVPVDSAADAVEAETTKHNFKGTPTEAPSADATYAPGGEEITMALLVVSGLLAVASFVAFLISLSSVRSAPSKKDKKD